MSFQPTTLCHHFCFCCYCNRAREINEINNKINELIRLRNRLQFNGVPHFHHPVWFVPAPPQSPFTLGVSDVIKEIGGAK